MKVLVTGASGFLGGALTRAISEKGDDVRILARPSSSLVHLDDLDIEVIRGSLEEAGSLVPAVKGVNIIYHCAAVSTDWAPWKKFKDANITGVRNLCEAAADEQDLKRFLHVSTTDVYGYPRKACDESHPIVNTGLPYNKSKGIGETIVRQFSLDRHLPVTVVRPVTVYGPRSMSIVKEIADLITDRKMVLLDNGASHAGLLYVENGVRAIIQAAESEKTVGETYNLRDDCDRTWRDFVRDLEKELDVDRSWCNIPAGLAVLTGFLMEKAYGLLRIKKRPLITRHMVYMFTRDQGYSIDKIKNDLGYSPEISYEEGIKRTAQWYREAYMQ